MTRRNKEQAAPVHQRRAPPATTKRPSMMLTLPGTHSCPKPVFFFEINLGVNFWGVLETRAGQGDTSTSLCVLL